MHRILIVEDDDVIATAIKNHITSWGEEAECVTDFSNVFQEFMKYAPHLILMDINLPFYNGYHWCTKIREVSKVPIIFISSATDNMNVVMAITMGGDDFICKPFELTILMAKVQAMLRRTYDFAGQTNLLECQGAVLNTWEETLTYEKQTVGLTKNEYKILELLMKQKKKVVSRDQIMTALWETDSFIDDNTLTVNMTRLRKKLESIGLSDLIQTKKGAGYRIGN